VIRLLADGGIYNQTSILISQEECDETRKQGAFSRARKACGAAKPDILFPVLAVIEQKAACYGLSIFSEDVDANPTPGISRHLIYRGVGVKHQQPGLLRGLAWIPHVGHQIATPEAQR
jgi:hypothetical protein